MIIKMKFGISLILFYLLFTVLTGCSKPFYKSQSGSDKQKQENEAKENKLSNEKKIKEIEAKNKEYKDKLDEVTGQINIYTAKERVARIRGSNEENDDYKKKAEAAKVEANDLQAKYDASRKELQALGYPIEEIRKPEPAEKKLGASEHDEAPDESKKAGTEEYKSAEENVFLSVQGNPLSTFSIDVDAASYANVRRFINTNQRPPKDAVRTEEMINYFDYDYPEPVGGKPFSIYTEISQCPWNSENKLAHIGLKGGSISKENAKSSNFVFLIDVSGSMSSPDKLPLLKNSFKLLVDALDKNDKLSIVVYAGAAGLVLPTTYGDNKYAILDAIEKLNAGGSTAGGAGIKLAYEIAKNNFMQDGNNRVILATDGDFNVGVSSTEELIRIIEEKRKEGIFLTVLGFGTDNLKDNRLEQLADKGNGNYYYIDSILEAKKFL